MKSRSEKKSRQKYLSRPEFEDDINRWMMNPDNVDILLNCFQSQYKCSLVDKMINIA